MVSRIGRSPRGMVQVRFVPVGTWENKTSKMDGNHEPHLPSDKRSTSRYSADSPRTTTLARVTFAGSYSASPDQSARGLQVVA